jgi:hypothetical protein
MEARVVEISFTEAQARVRAVVEGPWEVDGWGEFYLAPYGAENATTGTSSTTHVNRLSITTPCTCGWTSR